MHLNQRPIGQPYFRTHCPPKLPVLFPLLSLESVKSDGETKFEPGTHVRIAPYQQMSDAALAASISLLVGYD